MNWPLLGEYLRRYWYWALVFLATGLAVGLASRGSGDPVALILTSAVLIITSVTLQVVLPTPAALWVDRLGELDAPDLLFVVVPQPALPEIPQVPRDILLSLPLAVSNTGGRTAVLSVLRLTALLDGQGRELHVPEVPLPVTAQQPIRAMKRHDAGGSFVPEVQTTAGPWVLAPDDVVTLQVRFRRGIDWSYEWDLARIRRLSEGFATPIAGARVTMIYRQARAIVVREVVLPLQVEQQTLYRQRLEELTHEWTIRPQLPELPFDLE